MYDLVGLDDPIDQSYNNFERSPLEFREYGELDAYQESGKRRKGKQRVLKLPEGGGQASREVEVLL